MDANTRLATFVVTSDGETSVNPEALRTYTRAIRERVAFVVDTTGVVTEETVLVLL